MFDHNLFTQAGLKPRHVSRLVGVSRVTASNWLRGVAKPHKLIEDKTQLLQSAIKTALDDGDLPVSDRLSAEEASVKTVAIVKRHVKQIEEEQNPS
jgi:transcriptional regulator with XRE-family HTH domain